MAAIAFVDLGRISQAKAMRRKGLEIEPDADRYLPHMWWWALLDRGNGYMRALAKAGLDAKPLK